MKKENPKMSVILRNDKKRKDGSCPIYYVVRYRNKSYKFPTEYSAKKNEWNKEKKRPKDSCLETIVETKKYEFGRWLSEMNIAKKKISLEVIQDFFYGYAQDNFMEYRTGEPSDEFYFGFPCVWKKFCAV